MTSSTMAQETLRRTLQIAIVADVVAVDKAEGNHRLVGALERCHARGAPACTLGPDECTGFAASQLVIKLFPEAFAEQVECKRVYTRVSKCQDSSAESGDKVQDRSVHL